MTTSTATARFIFRGDASRVVEAKMPDGTRGFAMGRGAGLAEAASAAISRLKIAARSFTPPSPRSAAESPTPPPEQVEDAEE